MPPMPKKRMPPRPQKWFGSLRRFRHRLTAKLFSSSNTFTHHLKYFLHTRQQNGIWSRIGVREHSTHFGPKARIPDLFERRDQIYLALEAQRLQWHTPPPVVYHDLLDAAARVGRIEERMGYTFKDKMLCIEALKLTSSVIPLYFKGVVHQVDRNNRLALLGDRVLGLALCEVWFQTGNTTADYSVMTAASEARAVLFTRGQALGIHKNLLRHEWSHSSSQSPADQVAETVEAILGAVYLDSGKSIEMVKEVITKAALDTHKLLKADARSQDMHEQKELANLRHLENSLAAEQVKRQSKANTALTHANASKGLAGSLVRYKERRKEKKRLEIERSKEKKQTAIERRKEQKRLERDKEKSQNLNKEAQAENRNLALDSKSKRRAVAAANRLSKEGNLLYDGSGHDGPTADSERQCSPVSRIEDEEKVDTPYEPGKQDPQTSPPAEETDLRTEDQPQQNTALSTAVSQDTPHSSQDMLPVEELAGLRRIDRRIRLRWWREAVKKHDALKKRGINVDAWELYEKTKFKTIGNMQANGLDAPNKTVGEHPPTKEAGGLEEWAQKKRHPAERGIGQAGIQPQKNPVAPIKPKEETTQASASLLSEPTPTAVKKAESIQENLVPASITIEQERSPTIGPDETNTSTSTVPAPTQELPSSLEKTDPPALDASQQETSSALGSGENETVTPPAPVSVRKLSSSPGQPSSTKIARAASKNREKALQEISRHLEDISFASASAADRWDHDQEIVVRTKDVEQLERDIFNSHRDVWQANGTAASSRKPTKRPHKRVDNARRSLHHSRILTEQLTERAPTNRAATREEDAGPGNSMQENPRKTDFNATPFVRFTYYESDTERFVANMTKDDSGTPDTPDTPDTPETPR